MLNLKFPNLLKSQVFFFLQIYSYYVELIYIAGNYWSDIGNRKQILDSFAKKFNFDPLIARNWGQVPMLQLKKVFQNKLLIVNIYNLFFIVLS